MSSVEKIEWTLCGLGIVLVGLIVGGAYSVGRTTQQKEAAETQPNYKVCCEVALVAQKRINQLEAQIRSSGMEPVSCELLSKVKNP